MDYSTIGTICQGVFQSFADFFVWIFQGMLHILEIAKIFTTP